MRWAVVAVCLAGCSTPDPESSRLAIGSEAVLFSTEKDGPYVHDLSEDARVMRGLDGRSIPAGTKVRVVEDAIVDEHPTLRDVRIILLESEWRGATGKVFRKYLRPIKP
jgi:hypothetical protein